MIFHYCLLPTFTDNGYFPLLMCVCFHWFICTKLPKVKHSYHIKWNYISLKLTLEATVILPVVSRRVHLLCRCLPLFVAHLQRVHVSCTSGVCVCFMNMCGLSDPSLFWSPAAIFRCKHGAVAVKNIASLWQWTAPFPISLAAGTTTQNNSENDQTLSSCQAS